MSQQHLGARQGVDRTTMVAVVDGLPRSGLVERHRDPADRRAYALAATDQGRGALKQAPRSSSEPRTSSSRRLAPGSAGSSRRSCTA